MKLKRLRTNSLLRIAAFSGAVFGFWAPILAILGREYCGVPPIVLDIVTFPMQVVYLTLENIPGSVHLPRVVWDALMIPLFILNAYSWAMISTFMVVWYRKQTRPSLNFEYLCRKCRYILHGNRSGVCPECGWATRIS